MATDELDRLIESVTERFGEAYVEAAHAAQVKDQQQKKFFETATRIMSHQTLARRIIQYDDGLVVPSTAELDEWVKTYFPGWRYVDEHDGGLGFIIEEDPAVLKYEYINRRDKKVYGRTYQTGAPSLDDERLREEDPELWDQISVWPEGQLAMAAVEHWAGYEVDDDWLDEFFRSQGMKKILSDPSSWTNEQMEKVQAYMVPGKLTVRLVAPRDAKPEELE